MTAGMNSTFAVMIGIAAVATLAVVFIGVINMARKSHDPRGSNKLMRWRVILQAVAILLIVLFMLLAQR